MIKSFECKETQVFYEGNRVHRFVNFDAAAERKLSMLNAAVELKDLRSPPGNRLEALTGNRINQHSIRINVQWRICFIWTDDGPTNVEIVDYH